MGVSLCIDSGDIDSGDVDRRRQIQQYPHHRPLEPSAKPVVLGCGTAAVVKQLRDVVLEAEPELDDAVVNVRKWKKVVASEERSAPRL